jgi:hypothetical protein
MSELSFLTFCITAIALTAISQDKDKVAEKALSTLSHTVGDFASVLEKILVNLKSRKLSYKSESPDQSIDEK